MSNKILYGLKQGKLIVLDLDTNEKAKKQCFKDGCTTVIVADRSQEIIDCMNNGHDVDLSMFKGVVL